MADRCPAIRGLCRVRATLLDDLGDVADVQNNSWVSEGLVSLAISPQITAGDTGTLKNGCGRKVASFADDDVRDRYQLTLTDAIHEPGLRAMLLGEDLILAGSDVIGGSAPDQTDEAFDPARVALEFWLKLYDGDAQDQIKPWLYLLFPGTFSWVEADVTIGSDFTTPGFVGKSTKNDLWGDGPYGDLGITAGQLGPIFNHVQVDTDPPAAACGFAHIAPGS